MVAGDPEGLYFEDNELHSFKSDLCHSQNEVMFISLHRISLGWLIPLRRLNICFDLPLHSFT